MATPVNDFRASTQGNVATLEWVVNVPSPAAAISNQLSKLHFPPDIAKAFGGLKLHDVPPALVNLAKQITILEQRLQKLVKVIPDLVVKLKIKVGNVTVFEKTIDAQQFLSGCIPQVGGIR